jgi:hypothetical protein
MSQTAHKCVNCGRPASINVHQGTDGGEPVIRHYCLECADEREAENPSPEQAPVNAGLSHGGLLMLLGGLLAVLALGADFLGISGQTGFGWFQRIGASLGLLFVIVGAVFRVGTLSVLGLILFVVSLFADFLGIGESPGMGLRQQMTLVLSIALLAGGTFVQRRTR